MRLIDADELIKMLQDTTDFNMKHNTFFKSFSMQHMLYILENMKTIDPIKHGRWIQSSGTEYLEVSCSECGYKVNYFWSGWQDALYCPKCGARMDGEDK